MMVNVAEFEIFVMISLRPFFGLRFEIFTHPDAPNSYDHTHVSLAVRADVLVTRTLSQDIRQPAPYWRVWPRAGKDDGRPCAAIATPLQ
jgi:hypothetical protein